MRIPLLAAIAFALGLAACSGGGSTTPSATNESVPPVDATAIKDAREGFQEMFGSPSFGDTARLCDSVRDMSDQAAYDELLRYLREQFGTIEENSNVAGLDPATAAQTIGAILKEECARKY